MARRRSIITIPSLGGIDREGRRPGRRLTQGLRQAIVNGELKPGERLPSTRTLAASLNLARGTVVEAFEQLRAEGYLETRPRGGTIIVDVRGKQEQVSPRASLGEAPAPLLPKNVARLEGVAEELKPLPSLPFLIAHPAGAVAPDDKWRRLSNWARAARVSAPSGYSDPRGILELRTAIAEYVRKSRGVICEPEQIIVTNGTQQGLFLAATVLLSAGDTVWSEEPAYPGILAVLGNFDVTAFRIPVDDQGLQVDVGIGLQQSAKVAFVTPSHQYPLGMPMSMQRRMALLAWARSNNAWVVEDDYDSEFRYAGHPFPALQGIDPSRVIYLGTMSKVMFSSMRIGYLIAPPALVKAFAGAHSLVDRHSPTADQHVLARYMREGYFEAHIRRIRSIYVERRAVLLDAVDKELAHLVTVQSSDQGMHILLWLADGISDVSIANHALQEQVVVRPISPMYASNPRSGLMLGFGGFTADEIWHAVKRLRSIIELHR
ncbi:GntR family transcriptional regulator [Devosia yakushimensis]|uniref:GntR family transcriptional regulator n=1 Tax=Devosia yakushimensis TaxID=470028 RepID=A0ABQ5UJ43_9HYPH|nr:PLP-dependent aminotransferase family protein [Devosia yakushimensis]GLQ12109.1 GntR family transcriptional regulator [Devosia yakushimensis]